MVKQKYYIRGKLSNKIASLFYSIFLSVSSDFLYCLLGNIDFTKYITGSTIPHIYFKDYKNEVCGIPSLPEQTKIANFLSVLDEKMSHCGKEIEGMETWKKGLLQGMFV